MKNSISIILILLPIIAFSQQRYDISRFSDTYVATLVIEPGYEEEVFKKGSIAIYASGNGKKLLTVQSDELAFDLNRDGEVSTNVAIPYGEQSLIISEDFNFDGIKDLAVMDGQFSCYHGPSYKIYLTKREKLVYSPEFSRLAHEYCGMFQLDKTDKTIHTFQKSGCCWHEYSTFEVVEGKPFEVLVKEVDANQYPVYSLRKTERKGGKTIVAHEKRVDLGEPDMPVITFKLKKNRKELLVYVIDGGGLFYALLKPDGRVEFSYPQERAYDDPDFQLNAARDLLTFQNKEATYQIYEKKQQGKVSAVGIMVKVGGKTYDLKGDMETLSGTLDWLKHVEVDNLKKE